MTTKTLKSKGEQITDIAVSVSKMTIMNTKDMTKATEVLSQTNTLLKAITAEEDKVLKPLKEAMKAHQNRFKPFKDQAKKVIEMIRAEMSRYQTEETKRANKEKDRIAERAMKGTLKMETASKKIDQVDTPEESIRTEVGNVSFRTVQKLVLVSIDEIPREYMVPDESKIKAALIAGTEVSGAMLEEVQVPINRR